MYTYGFSQDIANTRANVVREGDGIQNQEVAPQQNQVPPQFPNAPKVENVTLENFRTSINLLAQALTA